MGVLFSSLWGKLFGDQEVKIVIVGLDNAGKTTILYKLHLNDVVHTAPTIGSNVEELQYKNIRFQMWDLGGQESLRPSWNMYYAQAQAIILVIDCTDKQRVPLVKEELFRLLTIEDLTKSRILIFANKQDVKDALSPAELSKALNLPKIKSHDWHVQPCCALTGEGLWPGIDWIVEKIKSKPTYQ